MTIGLYQNSLSGHHGVYARAIALAARERGWRCKIIIPERCQNHFLVDSLTKTVGVENVIFSPMTIPSFNGKSRLSLLGYQFQNHRLASRAIQLIKKHCDFIYVPTLDQMDQAIRLLGSPSQGLPMAGMCLRIRFHLKSESGKVSRWIDARLGDASIRSLLSLRGLKFLTTADPILAAYANTSKSLSGRVRYVPEIGMDRPLISKQESRKSLEISDDDRVVLVYGHITNRKGLAQLIAAVDATRFALRVRILVVGEIHEEIRQFLSSETATGHIDSGVLIIKEGFADENLQAQVFAAADAVWVAYIGHPTMSGVFYQAICAGLPIIAPNHGVMQFLARKLSVGPIVDACDPISTGNSLKELLENLSVRTTFACNAELMAERHRPIQFGRGVCDAIAASHGTLCPCPPARGKS